MIAIIGGGAATISAMNAMINSDFSPPCYAGIFSSQGPIKEMVDQTIKYELFRNTNYISLDILECSIAVDSERISHDLVNPICIVWIHQ